MFFYLKKKKNIIEINISTHSEFVSISRNYLPSAVINQYDTLESHGALRLADGRWL